MGRMFRGLFGSLGLLLTGVALGMIMGDKSLDKFSRRPQGFRFRKIRFRRKPQATS
ncbi:hypothetical protein GJ688_06520 [Heliobacillus mobilis]|uniref:Uncharacterized protein n=1 Tax=Heliobacterium mobile TaxID=28064 RepID=A0A6I3SIB1_HELMO|nr:hypothetical protein [Heliobacterium mobile]MTV48633.1 hypothetical protein [Heliobacterium mobile]